MRDALRNAAEHITSMMHEEVRAAESMERDGDKVDGAEAERAFLKYFKAFIAEVRSARDYMTTAANKTGNDVWIRNRFSGMERELFAFFNALMNLTLHQYRPKLEPRSNQIQYVAEPDAVILRSGIPSKMRVTGLVNAKYHFSLTDLDSKAEDAFKALEKRYPGETVLMLAIRYRDALVQILKNAERNNRFDTVST